MLEEVGAYIIKGAVGSLEEARALGRKGPADLVVLDIAQDERGGQAFMEECRKRRTTRLKKARGSVAPAVLVWSNREYYMAVRDAFKAGALGYVSKRDGEADLLKGMEEALAGERHMGPRIEHLFLKGMVEDKGGEGVQSKVSPREWEVFCLLVRMDSAKEISAVLGCSQKTVETHLRRMRSKLQINSQKALIRLAVTELEAPTGKVERKAAKGKAPGKKKGKD